MYYYDTMLGLTLIQLFLFLYNKHKGFMNHFINNFLNYFSKLHK